MLISSRSSYGRNILKSYANHDQNKQLRVCQCLSGKNDREETHETGELVVVTDQA